MEDLQIFRLFYFLIEERKYDEASITVRSSILVYFTFWKMDSANGRNFIHNVVLKKYIQREMYKKIVKLKHEFSILFEFT